MRFKPNPPQYAWLPAAVALCVFCGRMQSYGDASQLADNPVSQEQNAAPSDTLPAAADELENNSAKTLLEMEQIFAEADKLAEQNQPDQALAILKSAMQREDFLQFQIEFLFRSINICLSAKQFEQAQALFIDAAKNNLPGFARLFGLIENELLAQERYSDLSHWCGMLASAPFAEPMLPEIAGWHYKALTGEQIPDAACKILEHYAESLQPHILAALANNMATKMLAEKQLDAYSALLACMEKKQEKIPDFRPLLALLKMQLLIAEKKWPEACNFFADYSTKADDVFITRLFNYLQSHLLQNRQNDLTEKNIQFALNQTNQPTLRQAAARNRVRASLQNQELPRTIAAIAELCDMGFERHDIITWISDVHPDVMRKGSESDFKAIIAIGQPILAQKLDESDRTMLAGSLLDLFFRTDAFAEAAAVLDAGIPGYDPAWHASMKNKVLAHLALQQGNNKEALERFTKYLNESASVFEDTIDPVTGDMVTRDMILALNQKRIAQILASLGCEDEAKAFSAKAREHYDASLKNLAPDTAQAQRLKAERDSIALP